MSKPFSPLILPTEDSRGLQSSVLTLIDALNAVTPRLGVVEDILAAAGLATRRIGAIPMTWLGAWTAAFVYLHGDVTLHGLLLMIANKTTSETPSLGASDWDLVCICAPLPAEGGLAVTEGVDILAAVGEVLVQGDFAATEATDVLAATGEVLVQGDFAVTEVIDVLAASNVVSIVGEVLGSVNPNDIFVHNHGNIDVGPANTDKKVILGITWSNDEAASISSVEVGGISLSEKVDIALDITKDVAAAIWTGDITGRTGNQAIRVTFAIAVKSSGVSGVAVTGLQSLTPTDTASDTDLTGPAILPNLEAPEGGFVFACVAGEFKINSLSWDTLTERSDLETGAANTNHRHSAAWDLGFRSSQTIVITIDGTNGIAAVGAGFR